MSDNNRIPIVQFDRSSRKAINPRRRNNDSSVDAVLDRVTQLEKKFQRSQEQLEEQSRLNQVHAEKIAVLEAEQVACITKKAKSSSRRPLFNGTPQELNALSVRHDAL